MRFSSSKKEKAKSFALSTPSSLASRMWEHFGEGKGRIQKRKRLFCFQFLVCFCFSLFNQTVRLFFLGHMTDLINTEKDLVISLKDYIKAEESKLEQIKK